ncbi:MAG: hypothetical protein H8E71_04080 [Candidatus Marinimicrobia bacterium]|nr:hypothetical protein [Candidatus Neomarinimicrobiota bacterium]
MVDVNFCWYEKNKDSPLFKQLILTSLSDKEKVGLCNSSELKNVIDLTPRAMNHNEMDNNKQDIII